MTEQQTEPVIKKENATTYYVRDPKHSYGIFCINESGDLFLSSDWGFYGYAWRAFGSRSFKDFIAHADQDYIFQKFDNNARYLFRSGIPKSMKVHVIELLKIFQSELKKELQQS